MMEKKKTNKFRMFVNGVQTPQERRDKYDRVVKAGYPCWLATRLRDWTQSHLKQFLKANKPVWYRTMIKLMKNVRKRNKTE